MSPMDSRLSHSLQRKGAALISVRVAVSRKWAHTPAKRLWALVDVGGRPHLSPRLLPFAVVTYYNMDYYLLTDSGGMEGWVGHVGWPLAYGLTTKRSLVHLAVWRRIAYRESSPAETNVLPTMLRRQAP